MQRNTIQRDLVYQTVLKLANHPTADEVYEEVYKQHPTISKATVYRDLNQLALDGKIKAVEMPNGAKRFDHLTNKHAHCRCLECGIIYDIEMDSSLVLKDKIKDDQGLIILDYDVFFKGYCLNCQNKMKGKR